MPNSRTPQELILEIEKKDRLFRIAQSTFMVILILAVALLLFMQSQVIQSAEKQINTVRKYLHCSALTPIDERSPDFVDKCFSRE